MKSPENNPQPNVIDIAPSIRAKEEKMFDKFANEEIEVPHAEVIRVAEGIISRFSNETEMFKEFANKQKHTPYGDKTTAELRKEFNISLINQRAYMSNVATETADLEEIIKRYKFRPTYDLSTIAFAAAEELLKRLNKSANEKSTAMIFDFQDKFKK